MESEYSNSYSYKDKDSDGDLYSKLDQLLDERNRLNPEEFPLLAQIIDREIELIQTGQENGKFIDIVSKSPTKVALKFKLPIKENPQISYVGRIVGQSGKTVKHLQMLTGCKISVFGQGSVKDKIKEEEMRQQGGKFNHLNFELHVTIETICPPVIAYQRITHAMTLVSALVSPSYLEGSDPVSYLSSYNHSLGYTMPPQTYLGPAQPRPMGRGSARMVNMQRGTNRPHYSTTSYRAPAPGRGNLSRRGQQNAAQVAKVQKEVPTWSHDDTSYAADDCNENGYNEPCYEDTCADEYNYDFNDGNSGYVEDQESATWNENVKPPARRGKMTNTYRTRPY